MLKTVYKACTADGRTDRRTDSSVKTEGLIIVRSPYEASFTLHWSTVVQNKGKNVIERCRVAIIIKNQTCFMLNSCYPH